MIFAREVSGPLTSLVKKIDEATVANKSARMGSFVVFLSDDENLPKQLKDMAKTAGLKACVLAKDNPAGPEGYNVAKDASVTVVLYNKRTVLANHTFRKGELTEAAVERVVADLPKLVPAKK
jgi:hypothetical protein